MHTAAFVSAALLIAASCLALVSRHRAQPKAWSAPNVIANLSHEPFGDSLARRVAQQLRQDQGSGGLFYIHRDYCGHGLIHRDGRYFLVEVHDGTPDQGSYLAEWSTDEAFVHWLANQSDFSCSGADPTSKLFSTGDPFVLNNQRLTKKWLASYAV